MSSRALELLFGLMEFLGDGTTIYPKPLDEFIKIRKW
jgi:hypothetical protein